MQFTFCALASALIFPLSAYTLAAAPCPRPAGTAVHEILGVDQSDSISAQQLAEWEPAARALVLQLCPDNHLQIFTIHTGHVTSGPVGGWPTSRQRSGAKAALHRVVTNVYRTD